MKKIIAIALVAVFCLAAAGCYVPAVEKTNEIVDELLEQVDAALEEVRASSPPDTDTLTEKLQDTTDDDLDLPAIPTQDLYDSDKTVNNTTFATPEDAITHFVAAVADNDLEAALAACATEEYARGYNFKDSAERTMVIVPFTGSAPNEYEFFSDVNVLMREGEVSQGILLLCYSFFVTDDLSTPIQVEDAEQTDSYIEAIDPRQLSGLQVESIDEPLPEVLNSDQNIENFTKQANIYGADEQTERVVLYELDGSYYAGGFGLMRYGDSWKIVRFNSHLAGQDAFGAVAPVAKDDYSLLFELE